eukprot:s617_g29.t1
MIFPSRARGSQVKMLDQAVGKEPFLAVCLVHERVPPLAWLGLGLGCPWASGLTRESHPMAQFPLCFEPKKLVWARRARSGWRLPFRCRVMADGSLAGHSIHEVKDLSLPQQLYLYERTRRFKVPSFFNGELASLKKNGSLADYRRATMLKPPARA